MTNDLRIIDDMPTIQDVEKASERQLVDWYFHLRPTMMNEELEIVKAIARRVEALPVSTRQQIQQSLRR